MYTRAHILHMFSRAWLFRDLRGCSLPGSSVHRISQARILEYFILQGIFPTQGLNPCFLSLLHCQADSLPLSHQESPHLLNKISIIIKVSLSYWKMETHSNIFAWEIPQTEEPRGLPSIGLKRVGYDSSTQQQLLLALVWYICYTLMNQCVCVLLSSVMSNSLQPYGLQSTRLLCPWNFLSKNTAVGCHFLLQGIFPTQGLNLVSCVFCIGRQILYHCTSWKAPKYLFHFLILIQRIDTLKLWCGGDSWESLGLQGD